MLINVAIQGEGVRPTEVDEGMSLGDLRIVKGYSETLEFRLAGEVIDNTFVFDYDSVDEGAYLIGTKDAKGGNL